MQRASGSNRTSLSRTAFEGLVVLVALAAAVVVHVSFPELGSKPPPKPQAVSLDPALLRSASKHNPCVAGEVALTFDDGPDVYTQPILDVLNAYGAKATFFVLGSKVSRRPQLVRTAVRDGHLVENHTWDHPHLGDLTPAEIDAQIARTQQALRTAGAPTPTMLRAPFNDQDDEVREAAARHGLKLAQWDIDTNDWRGRRSADITDAVLARLHPGAVVLLHDGIQDPANTLNALPAIIQGIRSRGYCTATLS
ncbi:hypothetical protein GCM10020358_52490 [Amorphoplanes nipponensis]|uniref:NodB homology domain-containing protein n=1 Tax=Actinoplanes nipponensis TaxID=135950 RepID=A0A919MHF1_9ACTN|nr:polysaccharide deacetylase family protein [Actinoplanes nipponensis]GIE49609.1 hypothetical protein Ani05nite_31430 [Actinoplanes nipponensis]